MPAGVVVRARKPCVRLSETGDAFARAGRASVETAAAFAGEKWVYFVRFSAILGMQGELFRARTHSRPRGANFFAHRTQPRGEVETNDTSAAADAGQRETAITTARP